jgi:6-pyruvoyl-tetrahydropterin synthase
MSLSLFYRNVTVLDYAYLDRHRGLIGHSLRVNVTFNGTTDAEGILFDFSHAKKKVKEIIDQDCDHRLVVPRGVVKRNNGQISFEYKFGINNLLFSYQAPEEAICELPSDSVSYGSLKTHLENIIMKQMPKNIYSIELELEEEDFDFSDKATFHYTHGLKQHYGNCQRLYHGHKNTVDVYINGVNRPDLESYLAHNLFKGNTHFCFWENIVNKNEIMKVAGQNPRGTIVGVDNIHIKYQSGQGQFEGKLPASMVFITHRESTVENLSTEFAELVREQVGENATIQVRAYEGIAKGALTTL